MIKQFLIVVVVILLTVGGTAATRPDTFRVERSLTINASPERVFPLVNDFHNYGVWSPLEQLDPQLQREITGPARGKGATYQWSGNSKVGAGRMEIVESTPSSRVVTKLDIMKPLAGRNSVEFTLQARGDSTRVTWLMLGQSTFPSKLVQVFYRMDDLLGRDFENGLAAMKAAAEK